MASIQKSPKGYRAQVAVRGERDSQTFRTKREAEAWASRRETELRERIAKMPGERHTLKDAIEKYREEISPGKRGARWEILRIDAFLREPALPLGKPIGRIIPDDFTDWKVSRGRVVKDNTILREMGLFSSVFQEAKKVWRWIEKSPFSDVRRPKKPKHRERVISWREIRRQVKAMGYKHFGKVESYSQACAIAFLAALSTGMRAGELCNLEWSEKFDDYVRIPIAKTEAGERDVPLSHRANFYLERMRGWDDGLVFGLQVATLDARFRACRNRAGLDGFTFHDSRHTAATMIARKLDILDLCKMFGWKDPKQAMIYYNPTAQQIAKRLR